MRAKRASGDKHEASKGPINLEQPGRGRKPAGESRAAEICPKLIAWERTPEHQRVSLRALAVELGTSHQLLGFYLRNLDRWEMKEYQEKAREIEDRTKAEGRYMTEQERGQYVAYMRASLRCTIDRTVENILRDLRKGIRHGTLSAEQVKTARLLASYGFREAKEILNAHSQYKNNLPALQRR